MPSPAPMPAAFFGHGSPMNTLERNAYTEAWRAFGRAIPRPRAILAVSAHWEIHGTAVTAMPRPRVIHDFYGFPRALFDFDYPAPGDPHLAEEVAEVVKPRFVGLDHDSWGLDHGTWSVLAHVFPDADVPVVQLSLHAGEDAAYHVEIGRHLEPLRQRGVLIVGSGNVVHNLRRIRFDQPTLAYDWAERFDSAVHEAMAGNPARVVDLPRHADFAMAHPTTEHFVPLYYLAGLCEAAGKPAQAFVRGCTMGSISMASYALDVLRQAQDERAHDATVGREPVGGQGRAVRPEPVEGQTLPHDVPPEQTNT